MFNVEGTQARTAPISTIAGLQSTRPVQRLSTRLRYAWLRSRQANVSVEAAFDVQSDSQDVMFDGITMPLSQDRLRVLRANSDGDYLAPWGGILSGHFSASFGLGRPGRPHRRRGSGERRSAVAPGANANFAKVEASVSYSQPVYKEIFLGLYARAQYCFGQALLRSEQIGIASPAACRPSTPARCRAIRARAARRTVAIVRVADDPGQCRLHRHALRVRRRGHGSTCSIRRRSRIGRRRRRRRHSAPHQRRRARDRSFGSLSLEFGNQQRSDGTPPTPASPSSLARRF